MTTARSSLVLKTLVVALLLWVQGAALHDAAAHGDEPHEHYGLTCDLEHVVAPQIVPLPTTPALPAPPREVVLTDAPALDYRPWSRPPGQAPPPRSPPTPNQ